MVPVTREKGIQMVEVSVLLVDRLLVTDRPDGANCTHAQESGTGSWGVLALVLREPKLLALVLGESELLAIVVPIKLLG